MPPTSSHELGCGPIGTLADVDRVETVAALEHHNAGPAPPTVPGHDLVQLLPGGGALRDPSPQSPGRPTLSAMNADSASLPPLASRQGLGRIASR